MSLHIVPDLPPRTSIEEKAVMVGGFLAVLLALVEWQRRKFHA